ncbi:major facilitator superfamily MFS_1 [Anaeromyxobacter dehalogenans 2CP-1]|uniref:Major facilitator superfamily MFS_1 n=1 Tax=Anaeromyxobacter dehalogenans (strain ATCC BAA-258 / DSM 21875 / 2CP-1) TaxID=455488 RepID=B8JF02_ANAD2|nr:MFS transporter [Anaeromyxobacter dehalogenans]ACL64359.1 major facilitator superfamily MFS_1 [Anaeromyxobacter dehalogenans 2CP-1]
MRWPNALRSLRQRDLRLFFAGQTVSLAGNWMQSVAQAWLVWRLTRSSQMLGLVNFLGQVPVFLFSVWAGSLADRYPRRRMVLLTQSNAIVQSVLLAALTLAGAVQPWHVMVLAAMLGLTYAFEIPARQALLADIAGRDMPNAIALNSSIVNAARAVGPALAGVLVAALGEGVCFGLNALSFLGTYAALWVMRPPPQPPPALGHRAHLLEGIAYAGRTAHVRALLALLAVSSFFAMPYQTLLPALAADVLHGGASLYGALLAAAGIGALAGAVRLLVRRSLRGLGRIVALGATLLGLGVLGLSLSRHPALSAIALLVTGFGFVTQTAGTMTLLQGLAPPEMRGRVMGVFSMLFIGVTPFGALAAGFVAHRAGVPRTLGVSAVVVLAASVAFHLALPRLRKVVLAEHPTMFPPAAS